MDLRWLSTGDMIGLGLRDTADVAAGCANRKWAVHAGIESSLMSTKPTHIFVIDVYICPTILAPSY